MAVDNSNTGPGAAGHSSAAMLKEFVVKIFMPFIPLIVYCIAYLALFGAWFATVLLQTPGAAQIVSYIHDTLLALTGHVLTVLQAPRRSDEISITSSQAGRASPLFLMVLAVFMAWAMAGCAGFQQALGGYEAAAAKGLRAAEDNNIEVLHFNLCATPFSAAVRNPDIIAAMAAWCVPNAKTSTGAALLDAAQAASVPK